MAYLAAFPKVFIVLHRLVKLTFRPDATAAFRAILTEARPVILAQPGCFHMEAWEDLNDPTVYYTYSRWVSQVALDEYRSSKAFGRFWPRTKTLFAAPPQTVSAQRLLELRPAGSSTQRRWVDDYPIDFGPIGADHFAWLRERAYAGWVVITDENTARHCLPRLQSHFGDTKPLIITVPPGETHKNLTTCQGLWEDLFRAGVGRRWCVLNLGGGVIGDMGGFVAGTYKRGIDFVQIPTTLLSQVDASVGGKLGIDFFEVKNSIGLFRNPRAVWIDPGFLATLPPREVRSGFAEMLKHALIADASQWPELSQLTSLDEADWLRLILASVAIKEKVVAADPFEQGLRKSLNFGHTIGHALESYWLETPQRLLHGEAIAAGMIVESYLSHELGELSAPDLDEIVQTLLRFYGHQPVPANAYDQLLDLMRQDKKNEDHRINFTFLNAIGKARVNATAPPVAIKKALTRYNNLVRNA